ncbi:unnamed protein product [Onchocerca flexuosa]|uniref:Uncharacterized protein n=1 Tax=Onchocerca flexuosa TaxID=387005 RepID=A0A183HZ45_9BILA|nr:unnamed protein product [Onchocerca flexuosa]
MPPQESLIAKLLRKQTKVEQAEHETSASPNAMKSCYYNLDLQVGQLALTNDIYIYIYIYNRILISEKKWENSEETSTFGTTSEYCYCSNNSQSY